MNKKVALIIGSTSGIGKAMAAKFAREGHFVIVTGRRSGKGEEVVREIQAVGGEAVFRIMDVTRPEACEAVVAQIVEEFGRLDVVCYNAGIAPVANIDTLTEDAWDAVNNTNTKDAFFIVRSAVPTLKKTKGSIVFTGSLAGISAMQANGGIAYAVSKAGIAHLTRLMALALASSGVRVNSVAPGLTMTDILTGVPQETLDNLANSIPLHCIGQPEDIADAAYFLASDAAKFITGQTLCVDGGASIG